MRFTCPEPEKEAEANAEEGSDYTEDEIIEDDFQFQSDAEAFETLKMQKQSQIEHQMLSKQQNMQKTKNMIKQNENMGNQHTSKSISESKATQSKKQTKISSS